ncbi:hypothetical protein HYU14_05440 [Candidatus Woesearchaeota archaeon]|nr:hypothetical protein [Candidatus Woesearchaeota archaeon]
MAMNAYPGLEGILAKGSRFTDEKCLSRLSEDVVTSYKQALYDTGYWGSSGHVKGKGLTKIGRVALKSEEFGDSFQGKDISQLYKNALGVYKRMTAFVPKSDNQKNDHDVMLAHQLVDLGYFASTISKLLPDKSVIDNRANYTWALIAYTHFSKVRRMMREAPHLKDSLFAKINDGDFYDALYWSAFFSNNNGAARLAIEMGEMIAAGRVKKKVREQIASGNEELKKKFGIAA